LDCSQVKRPRETDISYRTLFTELMRRTLGA